MPTGDPTCYFCGGLIPCASAGCEQKRNEFITTNTGINVPVGVFTVTGKVYPPPMTPKDELIATLTEYLGDEVFAQRFADCMEMIRAKNADYTQGTAKKDRIAAFRRIGKDINVPMTKVWAIFAQKHWGAVMKFVKDGQVESEPIDGRINDLINYFVLLGAIVNDAEAK
jgi:hypothetical protein